MRPLVRLLALTHLLLHVLKMHIREVEKSDLSGQLKQICVYPRDIICSGPEVGRVNRVRCRSCSFLKKGVSQSLLEGFHCPERYLLPLRCEALRIVDGYSPV